MKKLILISIMAICCKSFAQKNSAESMNLGQYIQQEIAVLDQALNGSSTPAELLADNLGFSEWSMKLFRFRFKTTMAVTIPLLASAKFSPEIEYYWE